MISDRFFIFPTLISATDSSLRATPCQVSSICFKRTLFKWGPKVRFARRVEKKKKKKRTKKMNECIERWGSPNKAVTGQPLYSMRRTNKWIILPSMYASQFHPPKIGRSPYSDGHCRIPNVLFFSPRTYYLYHALRIRVLPP